jgi:hypothetical protein
MIHRQEDTKGEIKVMDDYDLIFGGHTSGRWLTVGVSNVLRVKSQKHHNLLHTDSSGVISLLNHSTE